MTVVEEQVAAQSLVDGNENDLHSHPNECAGPALQGTIIVDPPSVTRSNAVNIDVPVSGILTTHKIYVQCQSDLENGLICIASYCPADGIIRVRISNSRTYTINGIPRTWAYIAYI